MSLRALTARLPLRRLLTLPYVALILALVLLMGALSWRAGRDTVDNLSGQLIGEAVSRIQVSLERHLSGADTVLEAAFPTGLPAPESIAQDLDALRTRFWLATSVHRDPNNYVYYGDRRGHFLGLWRFSEQEAELRLRTAAEGPRTLYRLRGIRGEPRSPTVEDKVFEPRDRPWYASALASPAALRWTPVYIDFKTADLVMTRTKRIGNEVGEPEGVAATDLPLKQLSALLQAALLARLGDAVVRVAHDGDERIEHDDMHEEGGRVEEGRVRWWHGVVELAVVGPGAEHQQIVCGEEGGERVVVGALLVVDVEQQQAGGKAEDKHD